MSEDCRIDVWLWRARFFKTRSMAAKFVDEGKVRRTRDDETIRLDKASRKAKVGDELVFMLGGRLVGLTVAALGVRRGPASEARGLYSGGLAAPIRGSETSASPAKVGSQAFPDETCVSEMRPDHPAGL